ncbi:MAG TPA: pyrroline-5-carboxylate reductase [Leptospiraceae bacterium]|nr:pyrroline-5-carboxylate reductase [Spirochaetaceae bacterium]HBS05600.1 pyrroline-5-carboxylate reductase [Leptospiraceae bacterium]|tara:strand:+ start:42442 stop:43239 length:798 start_codon:yes stop_codon:yes gene_type:complete
MSGKDIGFLGFGKMAQSIAAGISDKGFRMHYFDAAPGTAELHSRATEWKVDRSPTARELETSSDILLICVKPQDLSSALSPLEGNKDYISIAAGVSVSEIISYLPNARARVARVMPNLGATINQSVSGVYCPVEDLQATTLDLFSSIGMAFAVQKEDLLHGVTALSGSGPAYAFLFLQSMGEAGIKQGLPAGQSFEMAARTIRAAMDLYLESGEHPAQWITRVSSPAGTTIEGLAALEDHGVRGAVIRAVEAAADRSRELGRKES